MEQEQSGKAHSDEILLSNLELVFAKIAKKFKEEIYKEINPVIMEGDKVEEGKILQELLEDKFADLVNSVRVANELMLFDKENHQELEKIKNNIATQCDELTLYFEKDKPVLAIIKAVRGLADEKKPASLTLMKLQEENVELVAFSLCKEAKNNLTRFTPSQNSFSR